MSLEAAFTSFPELTTERFLLRQLRVSDAEALFAIFSDAETVKYYPHHLQRSLDDASALIQTVQRRYDNREAVRWGIARRDDDVVLGTCGFHHISMTNHCVETGYNLNRAYWGQGIMAEAMRRVLAYGFESLALNRIEAVTDPANERSIVLLSKLGFVYEGCLRQRFFVVDHFEDEHYYGLLKTEWQPQARA